MYCFDRAFMNLAIEVRVLSNPLNQRDNESGYLVNVNAAANCPMQPLKTALFRQ